MKIFKGIRREGTAVVLVVEQLEDGQEHGTTVLPLPRLRLTEARHSPTGFEWGYMGSGPAELARALLIATFPGDDAVRAPRVYQTFKTQIIGYLDKDAWTLTSAGVRAWRQTFEARSAIQEAADVPEES